MSADHYYGYDEATDVIYNLVNDLMRSGEVAAVNAMLASATADSYSRLGGLVSAGEGKG